MQREQELLAPEPRGLGRQEQVLPEQVLGLGPQRDHSRGLEQQGRLELGPSVQVSLGLAQQEPDHRTGYPRPEPGQRAQGPLRQTDRPLKPQVPEPVSLQEESLVRGPQRQMDHRPVLQVLG